MMTSVAGSDTRDVVFISYSHADEPPWLGRLRIILKPYVARGRLEVWADPYIQVGDRWLREIRGALARTKVAVFLVSPNFLASDFIQTEEIPPLMSAAEEGSVRIVAVPLRLVDVEITPFANFQWARDPERPLDETAEEGERERSRNRALVEVCKKIAEAARTAQTIEEAAARTSLRLGGQATTAAITVSARMGALNGVPEQKPNFVPREADLRRLKETLLNAGSDTVGIIGSRPKDSGRAVGLHGMGGIGKTELAVALVNDDEVRRAFPDGIFWLTLGQTPDLLSLQANLGRRICGAEAAFADVAEGRRKLQAHFADKAALIVLDDLWQTGDAAPLAVTGPRGRVLTTTRDASLLTALGAEEFSLDVLSEDLALQVLANWSGQDRGALSGAAKRVAKRCGYLPLALSLAGAQVRDGLSWEEVLAALEQGDLEFLDHPYGSVFKSLRASIDALSRGEAVRYAELVVALEDVSLPVATVCRLWRHTGGLQEHQSRKLMQAFAKKALLSLAGEREATKLSFHDLQHDFLRLNAEEPRAPHRALLDAYRQDLDAAAGASPGAWARLPKSEPYLWTWLADHLLAAGLQDELRALLLNYCWMTAKLAATNVAALIDDYDRLPGDEDLKLVHGALQLSAHILTRDTGQLAGQLTGRLRGLERPKIAALVAGIESQAGRPWLSPQTRSLRAPAGRPIAGHVGSVLALAVTPDGTQAVSGSSDSTLRLWNLASGAELLRCFKGRGSRVSAVAVTPDGTKVLSGHGDYSLRLRELATGIELRCFRGHRRKIAAVAVTPDGTRAVSASADRTLRLWNLATGAELCRLEGHKDTVTALAVTPEGTRVISASSDGTLRLWDLATGAELRRFEGHENWLLALAVTPDGTRAVSGSSDHTLRLWDLATGAELRRFEGHEDRVRAVAVTPDGTKVLSGSSDRTLRVWDLATGEEVCCFFADGAILSNVCASDATFVAGSVDGGVHVLKLMS